MNCTRRQAGPRLILTLKSSAASNQTSSGHAVGDLSLPIQQVVTHLSSASSSRCPNQNNRSSWPLGSYQPLNMCMGQSSHASSSMHSANPGQADPKEHSNLHFRLRHLLNCLPAAVLEVTALPYSSGLSKAQHKRLMPCRNMCQSMRTKMARSDTCELPLACCFESMTCSCFW